MQLSPSAHLDTFTRDHLPPADQWPGLTFALPELAYPDRLNCAASLLDDRAAVHGADRPCVVTEHETFTYGDLVTWSNRIAQVLVEDFEIVPGNRVLLRGPNAAWLLACWAGVLKAGGVAVTTMPLLRAREISTIGEIARVGLSLCDHRFTDDLLAADLAGAPVVPYGGSGPDDLAQLMAGKSETFTACPTAADDVALLAFTSGTTGRPKATMHLHRDVLAIGDTFSKHVLAPTPDDVFSGTPPFAFTFGLGSLVVFPLHAGASTFLMEKATPEGLVDAIERHRISVLSTAPTMYRAMLGHLKGRDVSSLRQCVSAGETLPLATWEAFHDATGVRIIDGIGSTEMLHIFIGSSGDAIRPGSTGLPVPGYEARVVDGRGAPVPDGEIGRLAVRGPTGCRYLADPRQAVYVQDGWNITGDTYLRDEAGYFWYQARSDDMIIASGYNIAGPEVEAALMAHPEVLECAVIGAPDPDRGTVIKAFVVLTEGALGDDAKVRELQDFTKAQIAPYKYPRRVEFVESLPRTATGKLQRFVLREREKKAAAEKTGA
ncbi:MAG: AMP-binding protein [Actinomycetes bacterium]